MNETNPFIKCQNCNSLWGEGSGRDSYHNRGYCRRYSYDEFLKLMNEYPATEYTEEKKIKLVLVPEQLFSLNEGKYTICRDKNGVISALRYGKKWRDCCGDNLIFYLVNEIENLKSETRIDSSLIDDALRVCFCLLDYIEEEIDRIPENGYTSKLLRQTMLLEQKLAE